MNCMKAAGRVALLCIGWMGAGMASADAGLSPAGMACDGHGTELTSQAGFIACSGVLTFAPQTGRKLHDD